MSLVTKVFLRDNQIVVYKPLNSSDEAVKEWSASVIETGNMWPKDRAYLSLQDFSEISKPSHTMQQFATQVNNHFLTLNFPYVRIGVLVQQELMVVMSKLFVERKLADERVDRKIFLNYDNAIAWLEEAITSEG